MQDSTVILIPNESWRRFPEEIMSDIQTHTSISISGWRPMLEDVHGSSSASSSAAAVDRKQETALLTAQQCVTGMIQATASILGYNAMEPFAPGKSPYPRPIVVKMNPEGKLSFHHLLKDVPHTDSCDLQHLQRIGELALHCNDYEPSGDCWQLLS